METPAVFKGDSPKRLLQGGAIGAVLTMAVGFSWFGVGFGWVLGSTAADRTAKSVNAALVGAYAPVCAERFQRQANAETKWVEMAALQPYSRDDYIWKSGFATLPGDALGNRLIAEKCAGLLTDILAAREKAAAPAAR